MRFFLLILMCGLSALAKGQNFDTTIVEGVWSTYQTLNRLEDMQFKGVNEDSLMHQPHQTIPGYSSISGWLDQGFYLSPMYRTSMEFRKERFFEMEPAVLSHGYLHPDSIRFYSGGSPKIFF